MVGPVPKELKKASTTLVAGFSFSCNIEVKGAFLALQFIVKDISNCNTVVLIRMANQTAI